MQEITIEAKVDNLPMIMEMIDTILDEAKCPTRLKFQIDVAIDELCSNVVFYAYDGEAGSLTVRAEINDKNEFVFQIIDSGKPYNPLEKEDPDLTLSAEEREIGGLGIYIVKNTMDEIIYDYLDNKNILTIKKLLSE